MSDGTSLTMERWLTAERKRLGIPDAPLWKRLWNRFYTSRWFMVVYTLASIVLMSLCFAPLLSSLKS